MTKTKKEIHDAYLKRQADLGRKEMRGIRLTDAEEAIIKPHIKIKLKRMRSKK